MEPQNPMIADALSLDEDATGLCTVRELAEMTMNIASNQISELSFEHKGKRYNIELKVTRCEKVD